MFAALVLRPIVQRLTAGKTANFKLQTMETHNIIEKVCRYNGITPRQFNEKILIRGTKTAECHKLLIYVLRANTRLSVHQIAELLNFDISKVRLAVTKYNDNLMNLDFNQKLKDLILCTK